MEEHQHLIIELVCLPLLKKSYKRTPAKRFLCLTSRFLLLGNP